LNNTILSKHEIPMVRWILRYLSHIQFRNSRKFKGSRPLPLVYRHFVT